MRAPSGELTRNHTMCKYIAKFHQEEPCDFTVKMNTKGQYGFL